jgi:phospholipase/carboxylesterase
MRPIPTLDGPMYEAAYGGAPQQAVVFLHGYGADGQDLISLAPLFATDFPRAAFFSPHAPHPCEMAPYGRQWFSLLDRAPQAVAEGAAQAAPILQHFLDDLLARYQLSPSQLALVGFSQGAMMAMYAAPRRSEAIGGVVAFSGVYHGQYATTPVRSRPPVCIIHGQRDEVVPFASMALSQQALVAEGIEVTTLARPQLGHGIDEEGIAKATAFLKVKLG